MTHPLFAALDAALAEHGWPADCEYLHVTGPSLLRSTPRCSVYLVGESLQAHVGDNFIDAYGLAIAARDKRLALRRDEAAKATLRTLAANAGIDPVLVKE